METLFFHIRGSLVGARAKSTLAQVVVTHADMPAYINKEAICSYGKP
jgi:hypothetical protein